MEDIYQVLKPNVQGLLWASYMFPELGCKDHAVLDTLCPGKRGKDGQAGNGTALPCEWATGAGSKELHLHFHEQLKAACACVPSFLMFTTSPLS